MVHSFVEDAVTDHIVAEKVKSNSEVIIVSLQELVVNCEIGVSHVKHIL